MGAMATAAEGATVTELASLTRALAESGERLRPTEGAELVDIASSGGPGSLSTLLSPLYARSLGVRVAKISVPGRPAGALDVVAALSGFQWKMDPAHARDVLDECGYVHVGAGEVFCPLDSQFFIWRQANGKQAIPALAVASLLAKKLAAGVHRVVLDVRVGLHGNLGTTIAEGCSNAKLFNSVAAELGITAICVVSNSVGPPQPYIGRGEALRALQLVLDGQATGSLLSHASDCREMASLAADAEGPGESRVRDGARSAHEQMLRTHGVAADEVASATERYLGARRCPVPASISGTVQLDLAGIRASLVERQRRAPQGATFADPCGVVLRCASGDTVEAGQILATARDDDDAESLAEELRPNFHIREPEMPGTTKSDPTTLVIR